MTPQIGIKAAARIGNHIHTNGGSRFLIFVEGDANSPSGSDGCFWGENLQGVKTAPVQLTNINKLVYSPHCYGPSVYNMNYFNDPTFPDNLPAIWDTHYGFVPGLTGNALVVGEWGGHLSDKNGIWMNKYVDYLLSKNNTDNFFWCLNPNSGDTGGLLADDWKTPDTAKLTLLSKLVPKPTVVGQNKAGNICVTNS